MAPEMSGFLNWLPLYVIKRMCKTQWWKLNRKSGICAIIRHFATVSGHINLLGTKGCCLKVPSDFPHRSKLIEDLINVELTHHTTKNNTDLETFKNFELPELEHAFMEGIELSISDLAAFIPVYKYLQRIYNSPENSEPQKNDREQKEFFLQWKR